MAKKKHSRFTKLCESVASFLRLMSIGKLNLGLYFKGSIQYSTIIGGIASLTFAIGLITYAVFILISIFKRDSYNVEFSIIQIVPESKLFDKTIGQFALFDQLVVRYYSTNISLCNDTQIMIMYHFNKSSAAVIGTIDVNDIEGEETQSNETKCYFLPQENEQYQKIIEPYQNMPAFYQSGDSYQYRIEFYLKNYQRNLLQYVSYNYQASIVSNTGITQSQQWIHLDRTKNYCQITIDFIDYLYSDNILGIGTSYEESVMVETYRTNCVNETITRGYLDLYFRSPNALNRYVRTPATITAGLIQLGGLFGFIKIIGILIQFIHYKLFEYSLRKQLGEQIRLEEEQSHHFKGIDDDLELQSNIMSQDTVTTTSTLSSRKSIKKFYSYKTIKRMKDTNDDLERRITKLETFLNIQDRQFKTLRKENKFLKSAISADNNGINGSVLTGSNIHSVIERPKFHFDTQQTLENDNSFKLL